MAEDKAEEKCEYLERVYIVPLGASKHMPPDYARAKHAIGSIKKFVSRHMKVSPEKVWVDPKLNEAIWTRGAKHIPNKIKVKVVRFDDCLVEVDLETETVEGRKEKSETKNETGEKEKSGKTEKKGETEKKEESS